MMTPDLDDLVDQVRRGDRRAFAALIEACHVPVRALLSAWVHDRDDADDLAQQTFVFAYGHLDEYQTGTHFLSWLKAVARHTALDHLKRRGQRRARLEDYLRAEIARRVADVAGDPRVELLEKCLEALPEPQRSFLRLAHDRRSTLEALARKLRRSAAAVRKQLSRLYLVLRDCIGRRAGGAEASP